MLSDRVHVCELIAGTLVGKTSGLFESWFTTLVTSDIGGYARRNRLGLTGGPTCLFRMSNGNVLVPDGSFTTKKRIVSPIGAVADWCPDLCVEILSPDNSAGEMAAKRAEYFASGCRLVWEIDPRARVAVAYTPAGGAVVCGDTLDANPVLPGLTLSLTELYRDHRIGLNMEPK